MEPLARFPLFLFLSLCFAIGPLHSAPDGAVASSDAETQADQSQPTVCSELVVEPPTHEEPEQDAQHKLEADGPVATDTFPVLLHSSR
jgi:hypothetical protein